MTLQQQECQVLGGLTRHCEPAADVWLSPAVTGLQETPGALRAGQAQELGHGAKSKPDPRTCSDSLVCTTWAAGGWECLVGRKLVGP